MRILVTGGAGFIASHITDELLVHDHEVAVVDSLITGQIDNINPKARFYHIDILDSSLTTVFEDFSPEIVIHHAAQIDVNRSMQHPAYDVQVNILGTVNVLECCIQFGVKKIIYASSAAIYGTPEFLGITEDHPIQPINAYGISKYVPEHYIRLFAGKYDFSYTIFRYANVYGERQNAKGEAGVVSIFAEMLLEGRPPVIYGDGEQTRDFIYVKDVVYANILALAAGDGSTLNLGTSHQTSVNELFALMRDITDTVILPVNLPERPGDILHSRLDNTRASEILGWTPKYELKEGLALTVESLRQQVNLI